MVNGQSVLQMAVNATTLTEWQIVTVIITLFGFISAIVTYVIKAQDKRNKENEKLQQKIYEEQEQRSKESRKINEMTNSSFNELRISLTELNYTMKHLSEKLDDVSDRNEKSFQDIKERNDNQDKKIDQHTQILYDHDKQLAILLKRSNNNKEN